MSSLNDEQCGICLEQKEHPRLLPCSHSFCTQCIDLLRKHRYDDVCPLCRRPLPPSTETLYNEAVDKHIRVRILVKRGVTTWANLRPDLQQEMDQVVTMLQEAADQGHPSAVFGLALIHERGQGVPRDPVKAAALHQQTIARMHSAMGLSEEQARGRCVARFKINHGLF